MSEKEPSDDLVSDIIISSLYSNINFVIYGFIEFMHLASIFIFSLCSMKQLNAILVFFDN